MSNVPEALKIKTANISSSTFIDISGNDLYFENADLSGTSIINAKLCNLKINDADLSDVEINGAQLGGAYIHNIGMPPKCHPNHQPGVEQRPLKFENCFFKGSAITNCNLENVEITNCNLSGFTINGISVEDLLKNYSPSS